MTELGNPAPFVLSDAVALLSRTPAALDSLLRGLPEWWTTATEGPTTWSAFDVIGHLIHGEETDWLPRVRIILEHGESRTFEKFNREAQFETSPPRSLGSLLDHLDHVMQISRVLGRQYADEVGPWRAYLRVISGRQG